MTESHYPDTVQDVLDAWKPYIDTIKDWHDLVESIEPKATGCGPVYELENPLNRSNESMAIADMRGIDFAQPHYHANGETELYFVLQGQGRIIVGNEIIPVEKGSVVVTSPDTAHYTIPNKEDGLVLAVVNTPPFQFANNIDVTQSDTRVHYDHGQFKRLTQGMTIPS